MDSACAGTISTMSDAILTFQVQLSGVMETVLKSAMYEITRLVEDSFLEEVARSKQEVESLKQRLKWSESRHREREGGGRVRCADCGRAGVPCEETENTHSGTQPGGMGERVSDQQWSPDMRQDTAPPADALHPEQLSARLSFAETSGLYVPESEHKQAFDRVRLARQHSARRRNDLDSDHVTWTAFKLTDSDNEIDGLDPSSSAELESASPSAQAEPPPGPAEEGAGHSASPLQYLNVKSEGGVADSVAIKEEAELQPVCREEIRLDVAHTHHRRPREPWDTGDVQVENTAHLTPSQDAMKRLQSFSEKMEQLSAGYLQSKRGKTKSTDGQRAFSNVARQVLSQFQVWQNASYSKNIDWTPVTAKIISMLPQLRGRETEVIDRCTKMLQNRREYLRRTSQVSPHKHLIPGALPPPGAPPPKPSANHTLSSGRERKMGNPDGGIAAEGGMWQGRREDMDTAHPVQLRAFVPPPPTAETMREYM
ncbi:hypothetical protein JZ751_015450 [Albula glossodonta]|uniref:Uncharacterized protein n=1 Tax=Albula glossodonta TaxID=121402 RepID=A0A8T2MV96_9TELE|nr:hypothetical protein JZ751_015450 [Albula glossodonta]